MPYICNFSVTLICSLKNEACALIIDLVFELKNIFRTWASK
jgi:hypothetical protein